ncbi:hypothetical protein [Tepidibacter aestuarii]|nr:hypothetical protein [Tepidibacter aestuarii]CAH2213796.1 protein of unknown function [Tepidibacter aestuarii]
MNYYTLKGELEVLKDIDLTLEESEILNHTKGEVVINGKRNETKSSLN